jgi:hypothetical protein
MAYSRLYVVVEGKSPHYTKVTSSPHLASSNRTKSLPRDRIRRAVDPESRGKRKGPANARPLSYGIKKATHRGGLPCGVRRTRIARRVRSSRCACPRGLLDGRRGFALPNAPVDRDLAVLSAGRGLLGGVGGVRSARAGPEGRLRRMRGRVGLPRWPPGIGFVATNSITQGEQVAQVWPRRSRVGNAALRSR